MAAAAAPSSIPSKGPDPSELANDPRFREFTFNFLEHFRRYAEFYDVPQLAKPSPFYIAIQESDGEEATVAEIFSNFSLDFEDAMQRQNDLDNDFFQLMVNFPEFQEVDDEETWQIISTAIGIVVKETNNEIQVEKVDPDRPVDGGRLTLEEVWDCLLQAAGVGVGSLISIHAIKKLAAEKGVQKVVVELSKWLAKKAGWVGAIAMLIDFSLCINTQMND